MHVDLPGTDLNLSEIKELLRRLGPTFEGSWAAEPIYAPRYQLVELPPRPSSDTLVSFSIAWDLVGAVPSNGDTATFTFVPEPSTAPLLALGLVGLAAARRRRLV